jgi:hypothetical protein
MAHPLLAPILEGLIGQLSQMPGVQTKPSTVDESVKEVIRLLVETHQAGGTPLGGAVQKTLDDLGTILEMCLDEWKAQTPKMGAAVESLFDHLSNINDPRLRTLDASQAQTVVGIVGILRGAIQTGDDSHAED